MKNNQLNVTELAQAAVAIFKSTERNASLPIVNIGGVDHYVKSTNEYATGFVSALENGNLLVSGNQKVTGIRSIQGTQLNVGTIHAIAEIKVSTHVGTAATDAELIAGAFSTNAAPILKNAEFRIVQGSELYRGTVEDVQNSKASVSANGDYKNISPITLRGGVDFNFNFKLPAGTVAPFTAVKVQYNALEFIPVGK